MSILSPQKITALLYPNSKRFGGALDGDFDLEKVQKMLQSSEVVVMYQPQDIVQGVMFSFSAKNSGLSAVLNEMLKYIDDSIAYLIYGPVCIAAEQRGQGVLQQMYLKLKSEVQVKQVYAFIHQSNVRSLKAHENIGFKVVQNFSVDDEHFWLVKDDINEGKIFEVD